MNTVHPLILPQKTVLTTTTGQWFRRVAPRRSPPRPEHPQDASTARRNPGSRPGHHPPVWAPPGKSRYPGEGAPKIGLRYPPLLLQPAEQGRNGPTVLIKHQAQIAPVRKATGQVARQPAAGDATIPWRGTFPRASCRTRGAERRVGSMSCWARLMLCSGSRSRAWGSTPL